MDGTGKKRGDGRNYWSASESGRSKAWTITLGFFDPPFGYNRYKESGKAPRYAGYRIICVRDQAAGKTTTPLNCKSKYDALPSTAWKEHIANNASYVWKYKNDNAYYSCKRSMLKKYELSAKIKNMNYAQRKAEARKSFESNTNAHSKAQGISAINDTRMTKDMLNMYLLNPHGNSNALRCYSGIDPRGCAAARKAGCYNIMCI